MAHPSGLRASRRVATWCQHLEYQNIHTSMFVVLSYTELTSCVVLLNVLVNLHVLKLYELVMISCTVFFFLYEMIVSK